MHLSRHQEKAKLANQTQPDEIVEPAPGVKTDVEMSCQVELPESKGESKVT